MPARKWPGGYALNSRAIKTVVIDKACFMVCEAEAPRCAVVFTPALGVPAHYYSPLVQAFAQQGISTLVNELRGNGISTVKPGRNIDFGYGELINEDLHRVVVWTRDNYAGIPLLMGGHSLGGHLASLYTAKYGDAVQGLVLIASSLPYFRTYPPLQAVQIYFCSYLFQLTTLGMGYLPGKLFGFGRREAKTLIDEWSIIARTNRFRIKGDTFEYDRALRRVDCPILSICFKGDRMAPLEAVRSTTTKFQRDNLELLYLDSDSFEFVNHFNWVKRSNILGPLIANWSRLP
jgi:predicted alpha/beta hydrolase